MSRKIPIDEKKAIKMSLRDELGKHPEIIFAYIHGSFVNKECFNDIDIAVYLKDSPESPLQYELKLETELMNAVSRYQVDVRILNNAPLSFQYHVIKEGNTLIVRDDDKRADFQEMTLSNYFDFAPYRSIYLKETIGLGVQ